MILNILSVSATLVNFSKRDKCLKIRSEVKAAAWTEVCMQECRAALTGLRVLFGLHYQTGGKSSMQLSSSIAPNRRLNKDVEEQWLQQLEIGWCPEKLNCFEVKNKCLSFRSNLEIKHHKSLFWMYHFLWGHKTIHLHTCTLTIKSRIFY